MRRKVVATISTLILCLVMLTPVASQTSQGFEWIVAIGDEYQYDVSYWEGSITLDEDMYFNVTADPGTIPDLLTDWWAIPDLSGDVYYANGTDPGLMVLVFMFSWKMAVPIGNWEWMTTLVEAVTTWTAAQATVNYVNVNVDTWLHWGYNYNATATASGRHVVGNNTYLKSNGVIARQHLQSFEVGTGTLMGEIIIYRDGFAPVVESPDDIAYEEGESGHSITWNATDQNPGGYMVLKDDVDVQHGFWNSSSEEIMVNADGLSAGSYNYTIVFYEASGNYTSDTVMVDVSAPPITTTTTTTTGTGTANGFDLAELISENMLLIGVGGGVVVLIVAIVVLRKR
ncbi:MAG: hypothetical protein ACXACG_03235 [Candidatus Thorarchaeota archaeon]